MKWPVWDRLALLGMCLLAAFQVAVGIEGFPAIPTAAFTIGFGVLLVAGLIMLILGREVLDAAIVVIISTIIPLSISVGLVWQYVERARLPYAAFAALGLVAVLSTRTFPVPRPLPVLAVTIVHGMAGLVISILPLVVSATGRTAPAFASVGIGGALIGVGGLLLSFQKLGRPILSRDLVLRVLPTLLLATTAAFVVGFRLGAV